MAAVYKALSASNTKSKVAKAKVSKANNDSKINNKRRRIGDNGDSDRDSDSDGDGQGGNGTAQKENNSASKKKGQKVSGVASSASTSASPDTAAAAIADGKKKKADKPSTKAVMSATATAATATKTTKTPAAPAKVRNRQRVLILSSRGVTYRHRHLLNDLYALLPHSRKDVKLDTKTKLYQLNELAELYNCNNVMFFEARKGKDLYIWMSKAPNGPTIKMHALNIHTMEELHFSGNCLKGSRPILSFDAVFDSAPHLQLIKELLLHNFGVPKGARKSKPFIDHVMAFTIADGKIWVRCYQINETEVAKQQASVEGDAPAEGQQPGQPRHGSAKDGGAGKNAGTSIDLVEIGPRFVLTPIVILEGSFGGPLIYENKEFVSPNQIRAELRLRRASKYNRRSDKTIDRTVKLGHLALRTETAKRKPKSELDDSVLFA